MHITRTATLTAYVRAKYCGSWPPKLDGYPRTIFSTIFDSQLDK
jgi:hypothetical protein